MTTGPDNPQPGIWARRLLFLGLAVLAATPWVTAPEALVGGVAFALLLDHPYATLSNRWTPSLLQLSVVGLGAGMDLGVIARVGMRGIGYTVVSIGLTLLLAAALTKVMRTDAVTSLLVGVGTAICGGSAIAAVAPVVRAKSVQTSVALAVVFLLNAVALVIFPHVGHVAGLSQSAFGLWCALAIHDTSSVVGAALNFGPRALEVATTVKLARALWIIPLVFLAGRLSLAARASDSPTAKRKRPWFILGFVLAAAVATYVPGLAAPGMAVAMAARHLLVLTLFLIGSALSRPALRSVGWRPLALGLVLWILVASGTLAVIHAGWITV
jgi:uncharacterized integral membrane protein (TIGR00698 family)